MRAIPGSFLSVGVAVILAGCHHRPPVPSRPLFPMEPAWTRPVPATVEGPLAADSINVYVATRDGAVRALEAETGRVRWKVDGRPGVVAAGGGLVIARDGDQRVLGGEQAESLDEAAHRKRVHIGSA